MIEKQTPKLEPVPFPPLSESWPVWAGMILAILFNLGVLIALLIR